MGRSVGNGHFLPNHLSFLQDLARVPFRETQDEDSKAGSFPPDCAIETDAAHVPNILHTFLLIALRIFPILHKQRVSTNAPAQCSWEKGIHLSIGVVTRDTDIIFAPELGFQWGDAQLARVSPLERVAPHAVGARERRFRAT